MNRVIVAAALCWLVPSLAAAEPGLADEVYGPAVTRGESEFELRGGIVDGGEASGEWQVKAEFSHAFTDWWRPGLVAEWEYEGDDAAFTAAAIENVFDFTATRDWPIHLGGYIEYEFAQDGADALELKLLMQRVRGAWDLRANLVGEREVGSGATDAWEFGYAAQASYALNDDLALGVQGFGDAGDDDEFGSLADHAQYWGPFIEFEIGDVGANEVELQIGYLAGVGEAEGDGQLRVKIDLEFPPS